MTHTQLPSGAEFTDTPQVYFFEVDTPRPGLGTFGCVASSPEDAFFRVGSAGHKNPQLRFVRDLDAHEKSDVLNAVLLSNPLLGPEWLPFVWSLAHALDALDVNQYAVVEFMTPAFDEWGHPQPLDGPYFQVWFERDGSLLAEVGYGPMLQALTPQSGSVLDFLGFSAPIPGDPNHPNYTKKFGPGWNSRFVVNEMLSGMILSDIISTQSGFTVQGAVANKVAELGLVSWNPASNMFEAASQRELPWNSDDTPTWWPFGSPSD